jgi:hypothetical protein
MRRDAAREREVEREMDAAAKPRYSSVLDPFEQYGLIVAFNLL